ncbi:hypothetical protein ASPCADRAFT_208416 [Aspergillus carbonarius ITEM 5010]|uniref:Uncharacterized protein n=1 Tax=Aspergillus carbonarius (strain ITEM 5010) TaxID=602072 RepID=A0A1R3RJT4_ASPC5|nr:hypothetical protein ASPCADRAFT_208416 [Aspergillus carbonarius ITEM 5010]
MKDLIRPTEYSCVYFHLPYQQTSSPSTMQTMKLPWPEPDQRGDRGENSLLIGNIFPRLYRTVALAPEVGSIESCGRHKASSTMERYCVHASTSLEMRDATVPSRC